MKKFLLTVIILSISTICMAQVNNTTFIGFDDSDSMFGIISNNRFQAYLFQNNNWNSWGPVFQLPYGFSRVFYFGDVGLGVVINNRVRFYFPDMDTNAWRAIPSEFDFILPIGFNEESSIFALYDRIAVIINDRLQLYQFTYNDIWEINARYNLNIPLSNRYVFMSITHGGGLMLGIVFDRRIIFYRWDNLNNIWIRTRDFNLPNGTRKVFGKIYGFGIVFDNRIEFYGYNNNWIRRDEVTFLLR